MSKLDCHRLVELLTTRASDDHVKNYLQALQYLSPSTNIVEPQCKRYKDVVYYNFSHLGFSLQYEPVETLLDATNCSQDQLILNAIDIYNHTNQQSHRSSQSWTTFVALPITLNLIPSEKTSSKQVKLTITQDTVGQEFVSQLGEPDRKGGGGDSVLANMGPSAWMEWRLSCQLDSTSSSQSSPIKLKLMVELGKAARGLDRWEPEKGGSSKWAVLTLSVDS